MSDAYYMAEAVLIIALPFFLIFTGLVIRKKSLSSEGEKAKIAGPAGAFLLFSGAASLILYAIFILNYLGFI